MKFYIIIIFFISTQCSFSQEPPAWVSLYGTEYKYGNPVVALPSLIDNIIWELSSDLYEGRQTGQSGGIKSSEFIKMTLSNLFGSNNVTTQEFEVSVSKNPHMKGGVGKKMLAKNILCYIDNNKEETIIIGAHYDHLGYGDFGSLYSGNEPMIHNGADDNASGVALGISTLYLLNFGFTTPNAKNMYNYLFIAFDGEEMGLYGSSYFCKNPTIDLSKVRFMINLDMVGRLNQNSDLAINGVGTSSSWKKLLKRSNVENKFQLKLSESGVGPSDHSSFYFQDVPAIHFFTGQHEDYHKPSDDFDKINSGGILDLTFFIEHVIHNSSSMTMFSFKETKNDSRQTPSFSVTLGVMPDYLFSGRGMRIDGVSKDKTAYKYGVLKGDVVIKIGSFNVVDMISYMEALSQFKPGDSANLMLLRNGKEVSINIVFD